MRGDRPSLQFLDQNHRTFLTAADSPGSVSEARKAVIFAAIPVSWSLFGVGGMRRDEMHQYRRLGEQNRCAEADGRQLPARHPETLDDP